MSISLTEERRGTPRGNGGRLQVPHWLITVIGFIATLIVLGFVAGDMWSQIKNRIRSVEIKQDENQISSDQRFCRIEKALKIEQWPTCYKYESR